MDHRGHAAHFLTRVDRLNAQHAELALGLYRDHRLVKYLLEQVPVPGDCGRVALALDETRNAPHVIVSRDGKFITCLGNGMHVKDATVVPRRALDELSQRAEVLRELVARAKAGGTRERDRHLRRLQKARATLTREEFESLLEWTPLLGADYVQRALVAAQFSERAFGRLQTVPRVGARHEPLLRAYCEANWELMHLSMLLAADRHELQVSFELVDRHVSATSVHRTWFIHELLRSSNWTGWFRAALMAACLSDLVVPTLIAELERDEFSVEYSTGSLVMLFAALVRSPELETTIVPVLERWSKRDDDADHVFLASWAALLLAIWRNPMPDLLTRYALQVHEGFAADAGLTPAQRERLLNFSDASKRALYTTLPLPFQSGDDSATNLVMCLTELCQLDPGDLYVPFRDRVRTSWSRDEGMLWLEPRKNPSLRPKQRPIVKQHQPGRNDPCSCGSGKKYKRCCGVN